ncbi:hypothetical protein DY000_02039071 [Brassica cretica]|uniref:Uncharacterized protein n=1 Tax=Brassica cretica TaxID=69181 RepID=A0ABQ7BH52_BRACR|nr:hypothetical protein DY000_02039071 [Brassica cretica]
MMLMRGAIRSCILIGQSLFGTVHYLRPRIGKPPGPSFPNLSPSGSKSVCAIALYYQVEGLLHALCGEVEVPPFPNPFPSQLPKVFADAFGIQLYSKYQRVRTEIPSKAGRSFISREYARSGVKLWRSCSPSDHGRGKNPVDIPARRRTDQGDKPNQSQAFWSSRSQLRRSCQAERIWISYTVSFSVEAMVAEALMMAEASRVRWKRRTIT